MTEHDALEQKLRTDLKSVTQYKTRVEIRDEAQVSESTIHRFINTDTSINLRTANKLAKYMYGVDLTLPENVDIIVCPAQVIELTE